MSKRKPANTEQPLNVTPLIDILSNIVFFLMLSISFVHPAWTHRGALECLDRILTPSIVAAGV